MLQTNKVMKLMHISLQGKTQLWGLWYETMKLVILRKKVTATMTLWFHITVVRSPQRVKPKRKAWYQSYSYFVKLVLDAALGHHFLHTVTVFCMTSKLRRIKCSEARNHVLFNTADSNKRISLKIKQKCKIIQPPLLYANFLQPNPQGPPPKPGKSALGTRFNFLMIPPRTVLNLSCPPHPPPLILASRPPAINNGP